MSTDADFNTLLRDYGSSEGVSSITILTILKRLTAELTRNVKIHSEFKIAVVKESVPLALVAITNYCSGYFEKPVYKVIAKECFDVIKLISEDNNNCKAQLFKGECLFHFKQLLNKFDAEAFLFLFKLCFEVNAAVFLGRDVFQIFLKLYSKFINKICD